MLTPRDRIRGCLLAGAVGDAFGAPIEFMKLSQIRSRFGPDGPSDMAACCNQPAGSITDDTQMTLFTVEGLIEAATAFEKTGTSDPVLEIKHAYWRWLRTQGDIPAGLSPHDPILASRLTAIAELNSRRAPGNTCLKALISGLHGTPAAPINQSKGCGTVMRVAPVAFVASRWQPFDLGCKTGALTHGHPTGWLAAGALAEIIARLVTGLDLRDAVRTAIEVTARHADHHETTAALRSALSLAESCSPTPETVERLGGGWIAEEALAISVFCALVCPDIESAIRLAVTHSGDSDSTGSITGHLLGTIHGESAIPNRWFEALEFRSLITCVADDLHRVATVQVEVSPGS